MDDPSRGSDIYSRLLIEIREADAVLFGCVLILPGVALAGVSIGLDWPLTIVLHHVRSGARWAVVLYVIDLRRRRHRCGA